VLGKAKKEIETQTLISCLQTARAARLAKWHGQLVARGASFLACGPASLPAISPPVKSAKSVTKQLRFRRQPYDRQFKL
jgi:hypothetical protein